MEFNSFLYPILGGVIIGLAVSFMLLFNGRITGISGIIGGMLNKSKNDKAWRLNFILGLISGGIILKILSPDLFENTSSRGLGSVALAGVLVGFGTLMSGGCTSGHGVCGISRFSVRSLIATVVFIIFGILMVGVLNFFANGEI